MRHWRISETSADTPEIRSPLVDARATSPSPPPAPAIYLRSRVGGIIFRAAVLCGVTALSLWILAEGVTGISIDRPFMVALMLVGIPLTLWLVFVHGRGGIRIDDVGLADLTFNTAIRWDELAEIQLMGDNVQAGSRRIGLRFVQLRAADGRAIRFADLGLIGRRRVATAIGPVQDIPRSGLLLALIADRTGTAALFPPEWLSIPTARPMVEPGMVVPVQPTRDGRDMREEPGASAAAGPRPGDAKGRSLSARAGKYMGGFVSLIWVGLKTIKVWPAVLSYGALAVILSWQFAALFILMIGFHECGHVYAMWRCGVKVKGIYFIPFLGGAAVSQGLAKTRWANAFIQINGPVYGTFLTIVFLVAYYATGQQHILLAMAAGWSALINIFNLLPIMPLDGGRLLGEISHSLHRAAGRYAVLGSLMLGGFAAYFSGLGLLWIMVTVGILEFGRQLTAATRKSLMDRLSENRTLSYEVDEHFTGLARPVTQPMTDKLRGQAQAQFDMLLTEAQLTPMKPWQTATVTTAYLSLAVLLVLIAYAVSHIKGADQAFKLLQ